MCVFCGRAALTRMSKAAHSLGRLWDGRGRPSPGFTGDQRGLGLPRQQCLTRCEEVAGGCAGSTEDSLRIVRNVGRGLYWVCSGQGAGRGKEDTCVACRIETFALESVKVRPTGLPRTNREHLRGMSQRLKRGRCEGAEGRGRQRVLVRGPQRTLRSQMSKEQL